MKPDARGVGVEVSRKLAIGVGVEVFRKLTIGVGVSVSAGLMVEAGVLVSVCGICVSGKLQAARPPINNRPANNLG